MNRFPMGEQAKKASARAVAALTGRPTQGESRRKRVTPRTGERLVRLAFEVEELANRFRDEGHNDGDVRRASVLLGDAGRLLLDRL